MTEGRTIPEADEREWLSTSQAARALGLSSQRVDQLAREGLLPYKSTPLGRLFACEDVERLAEERRKKQAAAETA